MNWNAPAILTLIRTALHEDSVRKDLTTQLLIHPNWTAEALIVAKQKGVIAGLPLAGRIFTANDRRIQFKSLVKDGAKVRPGKRLALIKGNARSILSAERPALNALQHLSGIATYTAQQVSKLHGSGVHLYDTRKTLPGWRLLQKYAVACGGAHNHRMSLRDAVMVKDNHLRVARLAQADWLNHLKDFMRRSPRTELQMEVQSEADLRDAIRLSPPRVMLDNISPKKTRRMIKTLRRALPKVEIELTGGIRPENIRQLARLGADRLSMGRLTHSVTSFDCSLDITHVYS